MGSFFAFSIMEPITAYTAGDHPKAVAGYSEVVASFVVGEAILRGYIRSVDGMPSVRVCGIVFRVANLHGSHLSGCFGQEVFKKYCDGSLEG